MSDHDDTERRAGLSRRDFLTRTIAGLASAARAALEGFFARHRDGQRA